MRSETVPRSATARRSPTNNVGIGNRAAIGNNAAIGNRAAFVNRPTNIANTNVNVNRVNNIGGFNHYNGGAGWRGPYSGYHSGWVHGYWNGNHYPGWGGGPYSGWGLGGWGLGLATGIGAWGLGSSLYNWGYSNYYNPYYYPAPVVVQQPVVPFDYAQPIDTQGPPPQQSASDAAIQAFESARAAFKAGDYQQALALVDQALTTMPNDATLHEFRGLVLFALGQYEQAAAPLYAVLSNGPGWDWTTLVSLYPSVDVYTGQLRALEDYTRRKPDSAAAHFVLAYLYTTMGYTDAAVGQLRRVVALQPDDKLSEQLLRQLTQAEAPAAPADQPPAQPQPVATSSVPEGNIAGKWSASPSKDTNITLEIAPDGAFTWNVKGQGKGQDRQINGTSTYGNGILTLAQSQGPPMVGHVTWGDSNRFTFQVTGGPDDPGLTFMR
jgi:hypothetical protein